MPNFEQYENDVWFTKRFHDAGKKNIFSHVTVCIASYDSHYCTYICYLLFYYWNSITFHVQCLKVRVVILGENEFSDFHFKLNSLAGLNTQQSRATIALPQYCSLSDSIVSWTRERSRAHVRAYTELHSQPKFSPQWYKTLDRRCILSFDFYMDHIICTIFYYGKIKLGQRTCATKL